MRKNKELRDFNFSLSITKNFIKIRKESTQETGTKENFTNESVDNKKDNPKINNQSFPFLKIILIIF